LIRTKCIDDAKKIWWDIRPHPYFPTLEFRICDMPMRLDETIAIAALCQAIIAKLYKLHEQNLSFRHYSRSLIMENKWRAARYGLEGDVYKRQGMYLFQSWAIRGFRPRLRGSQPGQLGA